MSPRRHYVVPDCQVRPGDATDHLDWIAQDIVRRRPDVIVCIGDFWDLPSLSRYSPAGGLEKEGARVKDDLEAGEAAMHRLTAPIHAEIAHKDGHTADGGGLVEAMLERASEEPDGLKAGEAYRGGE